MDKYDEMLDIGAKNVMGIDLDKKEWTYDEAVNNYIILLDYYGNKAPIEIFSNMENLARLNLSFNYCTGQVLVDYQKEFYSIDDMLEKVQFNEHYRKLLDEIHHIRANELQNREAELSSLEAEEKTISEAEALIGKQTEKEGQDIGEE